MGISAELYEFIVRVVEDKLREVRVAREEYEALRKSVERLVEAHARAEERLSRLEAVVEKLVEAHARAEERLSKVEERLSRLEAAVEKLVAALDALRAEVGRLSEAVGFGLEDIARAVLPGWLYRHLEVEVEELRREFFVVDGEEVEVNLYGEGVLRGERIVVVGEVKSRVYGPDVERFYRRVYVPVSKLIAAKTVGILVGYLVHPSARRKARELGLHVIAAYEGSR